MINVLQFNKKIPLELAGARLDKALAELFPDYSRARLQQWIKEGHVLVDSMVLRSKDKVQGGEEIQIIAPLVDEVGWIAQSLPLNILYEDQDILVINKAAGVVVHPGAGNQDHTLVNALLHYAPELAQLPRAGIVHRIDKETSGLLVVARSLTAHHHLIEQLQAREFKREYQAVIVGVLIAGGTIDAPIGRHPTQRTRMAVVTHGGKPAVTHYRVIERYRLHTHIRVQLETGRTHQIRVHMAYKRLNLVGDPVYGGRLQLPPHCHESLKIQLQQFSRQALHAISLGLIHPRTGEFMEWSVPLPDDIQQLLTALALDKKES